MYGCALSGGVSTLAPGGGTAPLSPLKKHRGQAPKFNRALDTMWSIDFYRAMLCIRGTSHGPVSVRPSVCPTQVGVLLKQQNVGSHRQHQMIPQAV